MIRMEGGVSKSSCTIWNLLFWLRHRAKSLLTPKYRATPRAPSPRNLHPASTMTRLHPSHCSYTASAAAVPFRLGGAWMRTTYSAASPASGDQSLWLTITQWFDSDRLIAIVGVVLTLLGLWFAIVQVRRTRRSAESARLASEATRRSLRSADLRRSIDISLETSRRIDQTKSRTLHETYLGDWMTAYQRIRPLLQQSSVNTPLQASALNQLERTRGEVLIAREATSSRDNWVRYTMKNLRELLAQYNTEMEEVLIALENEDVRAHAD